MAEHCTILEKQWRLQKGGSMNLIPLTSDFYQFLIHYSFIILLATQKVDVATARPDPKPGSNQSATRATNVVTKILFGLEAFFDFRSPILN